MKNKDENTDINSMKNDYTNKAYKLFAMLSVPEFRQEIGQEKVDEGMNAAIGLLEVQLRDANLDITDFPMSVHELFEQYCLERSDLPGFLAALEQLQIEWHDYVFDPKTLLRTYLPALAPQLEIDELMAQAVRRAGLYAQPYAVFSAALQIIREQKASTTGS
jgi:hypothetical protein